jgi:serine acetyltransferase
MERLRPHVETRDVRTCEDWGGIQIGWRDADALCPKAFTDDPRCTKHDPRAVLEPYFESAQVERVLRVSDALGSRRRELTERDRWGLDLIKQWGEGSYHETGIHPTATIGGCGDGYVRDELNILRHVPHLGGVWIGLGVEIGEHSNIHRGTLEGRNTSIGDHTKVFTHVHVGHNAQIGKRCLLMNGCRIGGSCVIGDDVEIGLGALIKQHVTIGDRATIGMGAVVLHDVPAGETWAGNPARRLR